MPVNIRRLSAEETAGAFPKRGQMDLSEYTEALINLKPGDAAEVDLGELSSRAMKRRFGQAAKHMGYNLKWARDSAGNALRFRVAQDTPRKPRNGRRTRKAA